MFQKYILPFLALAGVAFAAFSVVAGEKTPPDLPPTVPSPASPYAATVAGTGLVEANTENIAITTPLPGVVAKLFVHIGDHVERDAPLFALDDRAQQADLAVRRSAIPVAQAQVADAKYEFELAVKLANTEATSVQDREARRFTLEKAEAQLAQAEADVKAGETELERLVVRSPISGDVLQLKIHEGEFAAPAAPAPNQQPLILLGGVTPLHLRVDVDEHDANRVRAGAAAIAFLRSNPAAHTPLKFVRFEPYVLPKKSLTGDTTERVDTRVLQIIFAFDGGQTRIFVGQQMDVFIEATAAPPPRS